MTPERWESVQILFGELVELGPGARLERIALLSDTEPELGAELRSLLASHDGSGELLGRFESLISQPRFDTEAFSDSERDASDPYGFIGRTISHYRVTELLGRGGMGILYKAEDTRLGRTVALKFLPLPWSWDEGLKARLLREARAAAALEHPNVCTIYEIGETDEGQLFIAMSFYEGETVEERLARGPLALEEALGVAAQAAAGLAAAHARGIVHRDIKPANLMLTAGGVLKILDFGIAKTGEEGLTEAGTRLGTAAYMSPEQTRGEEVGPAADLWALGVILYEMLSGRRPFQGIEDRVVIRAIRDDEPRPPGELCEGLPAEVEALILKLLRKDPAERTGSAAALLAELAPLAPPLPRSVEGRTPAPAQVGRASGRPSRRTALLIAAAAIAAVALVGLSAWLARQRAPAARAAPTYTQLTFSGRVTWSAISPNGRSLAYVSRTGDSAKLFVKDLRGGRPLELATLGILYTLEWSPDGANLLVVEADRRRAYILPRLGGARRRLRIYGRYHWSRDGRHVVGWNLKAKSIWRTDLSSGETRTVALTGSFETLKAVDESPTGRLFAFATLDDGNLYSVRVIAADGSHQVRVLEDSVLISELRWAPGGDALYYVRGGEELRKIRVGSEGGRRRGTPQTLIGGLEISAHYALGPTLDLTTDGRRLSYVRRIRRSNLMLAPVGGSHHLTGERTRLTSGTASKMDPRVSPDGKWIAYRQWAGERADLFKLPIEGGTPEQLTFTGQVKRGPVWSPDGTRLAFGAPYGGRMRVWIMSADGGSARRLRRTEMSVDGEIAWSPQTRILYQRPGNRNFHLLDPDTGAERPLVTNDSVGWMFNPRISPDGGWAAVFWNRQRLADNGTWVISLTDATQTHLQMGRSFPLGWSADGTAVLVVGEGSRQVLRIPLAGGEGERVTMLPAGCGNRTTVIAPAARRLVCSADESLTDAWMVENFDPEVP